LTLHLCNQGQERDAENDGADGLEGALVICPIGLEDIVEDDPAEIPASPNEARQEAVMLWVHEGRQREGRATPGLDKVAEQDHDGDRRTHRARRETERDQGDAFEEDDDQLGEDPSHQPIVNELVEPVGEETSARSGEDVQEPENRTEVSGCGLIQIGEARVKKTRQSCCRRPARDQRCRRIEP